MIILIAIPSFRDYRLIAETETGSYQLILIRNETAESKRRYI